MEPVVYNHISSSANLRNNTLTPDEVSAYLSHLSEASWAQRWPVVVYLSVLVVAGLVGNSLVLAVYSLRFPPSATRVFVLAMAVCDLITSLVANPLQLATIRYAYNTYSYWFCRGFFVFSVLPTHISGALLVLVSVDRFRRICRPLASQLNSRQALRLVIASCLICMVVFAPFIPLYGLHYVPTNIPGVYASMCWNDTDHVDTPYFTVYVAVICIVFFGELLVMGVAYSLIGRRVWQQTKKRRNQYSVRGSRSDRTRNAQFSKEKTDQKHDPSSSSDPDQHFTDDTSDQKELETHHVSGQDSDHVSGQTVSNDADAAAEKDPLKSEPPTKLPEVVESKTERSRKIRSQTTLMMVALTGLHVINWLPHLVLRFVTDDPVNMCEGLTNCGYNTIALTTRSYYLNSAVNAFVYGFCNERFRVQCRLLLRSVFRRLACREL